MSATHTATASSTASNTATPSQKYIAFNPASVLVLRVGSSSFNTTAFAPGSAMPVFLDEIALGGPSFGTVVNTVTVPTSGCTLGYGGKTSVVPYSWADTDGFPSLSTDGKLVLFGCYRLPIGTVLSGNSSVTKVVAIVDASGAVDTSTTTSVIAGGTFATAFDQWFAMRSVASATGASIYLFAGISFASNGLTGGINMLTGYGSGQKTPVLISGSSAGPGYDGFRCLGIFNGQLYGTDNNYDSTVQGLFTVGSGLPSVSDSIVCA